MARKKIKMRKKTKDFLTGIVGLLGIAVLYNAWVWYQENTELFYSIVVLLAVLILLSFVGYKMYTAQKKRRVVNSMPEQVKNIRSLLDAFTTDIPRFSRHSETSYQVDFGRYLKEKLQNHHVTYEETRDGVRPDIIIDKNIAIEIKALKQPNTREHKEYNSQHIDSIFKKIHTYKVYNQVIIIIFNSEYVKDSGWKDYEKMKEAVQGEDVVLFEK